MIVVSVIAPTIGSVSEEVEAIPWWVIVFFFAWGYESHLRIRHIESIKFHRATDTI